jgi:hypothetical protein
VIIFIFIGRMSGIGRVSKISSFDFLYLRNNATILKMYHKYKEVSAPGSIFTDYIFKLNDKKLSEKEKKIIFITGKFYYLCCKQDLFR